MHKSFAMAEIKSAESENPNGEFEAILSAATLDRDGEVIDAKAFEPLPESIPIHAFHDFHDPIGRATPYYEDDKLKVRGMYASTPRAQEIRTLVAEGVIGHMSVGFMSATRSVTDGDDAPHITKGEILEGSFVSVPSNRESAVLMAKSYDDSLSQAVAAAVAIPRTLSTVVTVTTPQEPATQAPVPPADEAGKAPASAVVEAARIRARAALLGLPS